MKKYLGFTLTEMAVVLLIMGIVSLMALKYVQKLTSAGKLSSRQAEFEQTERNFMEWIKARQNPGVLLPAATGLDPFRTSGFYHMPDNSSGSASRDGFTRHFFSDSAGTPWGYLVAYELTTEGVCSPNVRALYVREHFSPSEYIDRADVAVALFTNDPSYHWVSLDIPPPVSYINFQVYHYLLGASVTHAVAPTHAQNERFLRFISISELRELAGCTPLSKTIAGTTTLPLAYVNRAYEANLRIHYDTGGSMMYCFIRGDNMGSEFKLIPGSGTTPDYFSTTCAGGNGAWFSNINTHLRVYAASVADSSYPVRKLTVYMRHVNSMVADPVMYTHEYIIPVGKVEPW